MWSSFLLVGLSLVFSLLMAMLTAIPRNAPCFCYLGSVNALEVVPELLLLLLHQLLRLELLVVAQLNTRSILLLFLLAFILNGW